MREPSSARPTAASSSGRRSAHRCTQLRAIETREPLNQVVHSGPRDESSTLVHGSENSIPRSSTTSGQNHSGSAAERRTSSAYEATPARRRSRVTFACATVASSGRHTTSVTRPSVPRFAAAAAGHHALASSLDAPFHDGREQEVVDARGRERRAVHDHARQHGRQRRPARDPERPRADAVGARVGRDRLRPDVRGVHAHGRQARGPARAAPDLHGRPRRLHRRLARVRPRPERRLPDRRARRPGPRRSPDEPCDALDHHGDVPAAAARDGDRDLGRRLRHGARDRPACRRPPDRARELELDLLHQRADRDRRAVRDPDLHRRVARHLARPAARRPRAALVGDRPLRAHLRVHRGEQLRLDVAAHPGRVRARRRVARDVRPARAEPARAHARPRALQEPDVRRREHGDALRRPRDVRGLLLRLDLHAADPRLLAGPGGGDLPADDAARDPARPADGPPRRPFRVALARRRRHDAALALAPAGTHNSGRARRSGRSCPACSSAAWGWRAR